MNSWTRRDFSKTLALAGSATALGQTRVLGANERVRLGFIGLGNRGDQVLDAFLAHPDRLRHSFRAGWNCCGTGSIHT